MIAPVRERHFDHNGMRFAAQEYGKPGGLPVLALHGWMDNAASFFRLAPLLENCHIVALDMAGHGLSSHRPGANPYNIWEDVAEIYAIADQLGWQRFALLGHSRGAIISVLAAGTFPERISHLALIDGLWPMVVEAADAPAQLALSILDNQNPRKQRHKTYSDIERMIVTLQQSRSALSREAAEAMAVRGVRELAEGFTWSSDPHLKTASAFKLTQEHMQAFVRRISAPTHLTVAKAGLPQLFAQYQQDVALFESIGVDVLDGGHHLHMEAEAPKVAELLNRFFGSNRSAN